MADIEMSIDSGASKEVRRLWWGRPHTLREKGKLLDMKQNSIVKEWVKSKDARVNPLMQMQTKFRREPPNAMCRHETGRKGRITFFRRLGISPAIVGLDVALMIKDTRKSHYHMCPRAHVSQ